MFNRQPRSTVRAGRPPATAAGLCLGVLLSPASVRLSEEDFLRLVGMFSTAAITLMTMRSSAVRGQVQ